MYRIIFPSIVYLSPVIVFADPGHAVQDSPSGFFHAVTSFYHLFEIIAASPKSLWIGVAMMVIFAVIYRYIRSSQEGSSR